MKSDETIAGQSSLPQLVQTLSGLNLSPRQIAMILMMPVQSAREVLSNLSGGRQLQK